MRKVVLIVAVLFSGVLITACTETVEKEVKKEKQTSEKEEMKMRVKDGRVSLKLNSMQKNHQLKNMRSHLEAVQNITLLLANENYDEASVVAYEQLGSTTEMKLMCASFGNETFENLGLEFHKSADEMSEIFKTKNSKASLEALSNTINYCVQCHAAFKQ